ncbi:MAG: metallophosphoesterase [Gemmataceae bacterium]
MLVQSLVDGPIDVIGDVHGEWEILQRLIQQMGYDSAGRHPQERKLVFVGDLADRGPDSPAVVLWVRDRVREGRAQAILGNHEFNALEAAQGGRLRKELCWLFPDAPPLLYRGQPVPQREASPEQRQEILAFFRSLPLALERQQPQPTRVIHAVWNSPLVDRLRHESDVVQVYHRERDLLHHALEMAGGFDRTGANLILQNCNPVKHLLSGVETRSHIPIRVNEETRWEKRHPWWHDYKETPLVIIGHYWRIALPGETLYESLFDGLPPDALHGKGPVMCIDYSAGKRYRERMQNGLSGPFHTRLAALRLPENLLLFDNGETMPLRDRRLSASPVTR